MVNHKKEKETQKKKVNIENKTNKSSAGNIDTLKEQLLRVNADFQNFKNRVEKEKSEWITVAQATVIEKFLPIMDDLDRALQACKKEEMDKKQLAWLQGFEIIQKNLKKTFSELEVKQIDCSGDFNPDFHEALIQVDSPDHESGQIVQVLNKGYLFKGKVLRHAKVSVAK